MVAVTNTIDPIYKAQHTLIAIDEQIEADQGAAFRVWSQQALPAMGDAYRGEEDMPFRTHLGASMIGGDCARALWYGFRWTTAPRFPARVLRLFNRGHLEEARFIAMLLAIGCEVYQQDAEGNQYRISDAGGHFGGSTDGVVLGLPDLEGGTPALAEFKTHNDKSFKNLEKLGVRATKFEHYVQMQVYMKKMGLPIGIYMAVNKNDDAVYAELIRFNNEVAEEYITRGVTIVFADEAPKRISESPGWYKCKWCDHYSVCHKKGEPEHNCRTCYYSKPMPDGTWACNYHHKTLSKEEQYAGCNSWTAHQAFAKS